MKLLSSNEIKSINGGSCHCCLDNPKIKRLVFQPDNDKAKDNKNTCIYECCTANGARWYWYTDDSSWQACP